MAVPAKYAAADPVTGLRGVKKVVTLPNGRRYIDVGAGWTPAFEPVRIIIGPHANPNIDDVLALFDRKPSVVRPDYPIR
jgi:hypothetical protein